MAAAVALVARRARRSILVGLALEIGARDRLVTAGLRLRVDLGFALVLKGRCKVVLELRAGLCPVHPLLSWLLEHPT